MKNVRSDRDSSIDRLLAETLEAQAALVPEGPCLDAETLAAWADDTLGSHERALAEAHAANCARCQTLSAAMVKTTPPAVAEKSAWRIPALRWLIPLTAAATAVFVWAIASDRATLPRNDRPVPAVDKVATAPASADNTPARLDAQMQRQLSASRAPTNINNAPPPAASGQRDASLREEGATAALDGRAPIPVSPKRLSETAVVGDEVRVEPSRAAAGSLAPPLPAKTGSTVALARRTAADSVIVSSIPVSRWRIVPDGAVQRSTDGGLTWLTQETGATVTLAGGASPSPSVCWLVGPVGTVLLSTDGRSWQRIAFPEATDLMSVRAIDDKSATVTASDGRTFSTKDGGLTWVRSGNVQ